MSLRTIVPCMVAGALALTVGCAADSDPNELISHRPGGGGVWLNTSVLGVLPLSELDLGGTFHKGVRLDEVLIKDGDGWALLDKVWSEDGQLRGIHGGTLVDGMGLVGSRWSLTLEGKDGGAATLWIDEATAEGGQWRYVFAYDNGKGTAHPLCDEDTLGDHRAVAIADLTVDPESADMAERQGTLYIACLSGAVGKAVDWEYAPWELGVADFEAVVRAIRADYCGDGVSWTKPGTSIQIQDVWGIHDFSAPIGATEALWGRGGAICLSKTRAEVKVECEGGEVPACGGNASLESEPGALLWTKVPPRGRGAAKVGR